LPKIAVTVDLLTTGIDVPKIANLVFLRRVNSRILYEQMLGRATRKCDEIGKETFRIFDAVDLYPTLQDLTDMKPVVVNPNIAFEQLIAEFVRATDEAHRAVIKDQLVVKLRRKVKRLSTTAREAYRRTAGETPEDTLHRLENGSLDDVATWLGDRQKIGPILDWSTEGTSTPLAVSHHDDALVAITMGYGKDGSLKRPEDFLDTFAAFVRDNLNLIAALTIVTTRPRDLTRAQLQELRRTLDDQGFSEAQLRRAWEQAKNQDIAASIIGYVRQAALGDPLVPYTQRVGSAMARILARPGWTEIQKRWLKRIGEQMEKEVVVDRAALDSGQFQVDTGGFDGLNRKFGGSLEQVLGDIADAIWTAA
jgi:type I restriction enzyme R subunit